MNVLDSWKDVKPVIGMIHLKPLPGSPGFEGSIPRVLDGALTDAERLAEGGFDGLIVENYGDVPFFPREVPSITIAHMTAIAAKVRERFDLPLGINVLRNDGSAALAVAHAAGASFVRVNVLTGVRIADQGLIEGIAHDLARNRRSWGADRIAILADVDVKHSQPLGTLDLEGEVKDTLERGAADAIIISGRGTGEETDLDHIRRAKRAAGTRKVLVGSGVGRESVARYLAEADGVILGTAIKQGGEVTRPVDPERVRDLMAELDRERGP